jgi:hypothetical protein
MSKPKWVLWFLYQFWVTAMMISLLMLPFIYVFADDKEWTDFSPQPLVVEIIEEKPIIIDKEKYRIYFEDRELVMMVLGGIEWWNLNCGTLSGTGEYFINLAKEKHDIIKEEMQGSMIFQTGHFAAALYNNCDVFLEQTETIGLNIMLEKTSQETQLDTISETAI